ncbi:WD repeat-containing protein 19-like [Manduca sexta]|uniref:WD repeat-containing protein 19-like n=1 Tax=Manduca sexta TaxID=7130 RepID=UPI00188FD858|nr:WD repeat-containing protein 19-like [Manduca sexta]
MRGVTTAMKHSEDHNLIKDCAQLLEEEKQFNHAAALYDHYARAKEAEGRYHDALKSYLKAQDYEAAIRLNLDKLDDIDEAVNLVQETKSVQGAKMVANYFQNSDDPTSAIKFLVMSLCYDDAFNLARKNGKLHLYGEILIQTSQARPEDFKSLALHFEGEKNHLLAGKFYFHAGEHSKAMSHLLKAGGSEEDENEAITVAIDAAAASDDERLTRRLIEFLLGETDGTPREPRHLFRLYMAKKQFTEAAKTAVIIAGAECRAGGTAGATWRAAYQVSILTSTVIECSRAGLKHQAHHWAKVLMQPEYRSQVYSFCIK